MARLVWGDASLWYKLAEANGLSAATTLSAGQSLRIPGGVQVNTHNASTHAPYDPAKALGDIHPTTPEPQKKSNKCGVFGQVLLAVVAVAVSIALPGGVTFVGGAINAALGSAASQAVGVATGIQDKFSFKGVALAAISGGISGGISELGAAAKAAQGTGKALNGLGKVAKFLNKGGIVSSAARGALSSAITQGITTASGLQSKFSFAGVAAAGVGAAAGSALGSSFGAPASKLAAFGQNVAVHTASGIANAATRSAINGDSFGGNLKAAIPDIIGQAVGGAIGRAVYDPGRAARRQVEEPLAAGKLATDGEVVTSNVLAQSLNGFTPSDAELALLNATYDASLSLDSLTGSGAGRVLLAQMPESASASALSFLSSASVAVLPPYQTQALSDDVNTVAKLDDVIERQRILFATHGRRGIGTDVLIGLREHRITLWMQETGRTLDDYIEEYNPLNLIDGQYEGLANFLDQSGIDSLTKSSLAYVQTIALDGPGARPGFEIWSPIDSTFARAGYELENAFFRSYQRAVHGEIPTVYYWPADVREALGPVPPWIRNPHTHHIVERNGSPGIHREFVRESQQILRDVGIDPIRGIENLVIAPNQGHTFSAAKDLLFDLRGAAGSRGRVVDILFRHGQRARNRGRP